MLTVLAFSTLWILYLVLCLFFSSEFTVGFKTIRVLVNMCLFIILKVILRDWVLELLIHISRILFMQLESLWVNDSFIYFFGYKCQIIFYRLLFKILVFIDFFCDDWCMKFILKKVFKRRLRFSVFWIRILLKSDKIKNLMNED